jgi:hypothetical protein
MSISSFKLLLVVCAVGLLTACQSAKKIKTSPQKVDTMLPLSISSLLAKIDSQSLNAERLNGDVDVDYKGKPMNVSATAMARWRRDSVIWLNIKKLGFNIARVQVTPDSVFVINYLQGNYVATDWSYIEKAFGSPLSFGMLQDILLGKPIFLTDKNALSMEKTVEGLFILRGGDKQRKASYTINPTHFSITDMLFEEPTNDRYLKITYQNYGILSQKTPTQRSGALATSKAPERLFAYRRILEIQSKQTGKAIIEIEIDPESVEIDLPKTIRFEIPSHYTRLE